MMRKLGALVAAGVTVGCIAGAVAAAVFDVSLKLGGHY